MGDAKTKQHPTPVLRIRHKFDKTGNGSRAAQDRKTANGNGNWPRKYSVKSVVKFRHFSSIHLHERAIFQSIYFLKVWNRRNGSFIGWTWFMNYYQMRRHKNNNAICGKITPLCQRTNKNNKIIFFGWSNISTKRYSQKQNIFIYYVCKIFYEYFERFSWVERVL